MMTIDFRRDPINILLLAALLIAGFFLPSWLRFLLQMAVAGGLVALGVMIQMRAGLVSFGQGLYFCIGAYAVGMMAVKMNVTELGILIPVAIIVTAVVGGILGLLLSRYRDIFFAMLSLALSMILYGLLVKAAWLGSTDGFNIPEVSYLGHVPAQAVREDWSYTLTVVLVLISCFAVARYLASGAGALCDAVAQNELRLEYLGTSARKVVFIVYLVAATISGLGGALAAIAMGHIGPEMTNWTTSGGFVFVALLAGRGSVIAPVLGFFLLELVRTYALDYAPNAWQMILGAVMLAVILLLPEGLWSLVRRRAAK